MTSLTRLNHKRKKKANKQQRNQAKQKYKINAQLLNGGSSHVMFLCCLGMLHIAFTVDPIIIVGSTVQSVRRFYTIPVSTRKEKTSKTICVAMTLNQMSLETCCVSLVLISNYIDIHNIKYSIQIVFSCHF